MPVSVLRYISHPEVAIDPEVPVPRWGLSEAGRERGRALCCQPWLAEVRRVVTSPETKALELASMLAEHLELPINIRPETGETDRSSTGYVAHEQHEQLADAFFLAPLESASGWERAIDVQTRMIDALADLLDSSRNTIVVGHGAAGTLWYCALAGVPIDRSHDQPGAGHYWSYDLENGTMIHGWKPIDG